MKIAHISVLRLGERNVHMDGLPILKTTSKTINGSSFYAFIKLVISKSDFC
ncbi:hypothetical protein VCRA2116O29_400043 [Vibrio crassostreae]|nr:hypothetical protein VCRA2116O29_400043 [Vibrio crassostreae]CAK3798417.1 hypothetical protein VCRA2123O74_360043 [Vibrio crassostreae]